MQYAFLYVFLMAGGDTLSAMREAHTETHRPVRSYEQCVELAQAREARLREGLDKGSGVILDVQIICKTRRVR